MRLQTANTGCPILRRGRFWLDCELVGHLAPDASHRVYIGQVVAAGSCERFDDAIALMTQSTLAPMN
jgi:flavin reductase (DIM6/NTAB) family NADH-FMN oxidoreductase RutF